MRIVGRSENVEKLTKIDSILFFPESAIELKKNRDATRIFSKIKLHLCKNYGSEIA